MRRDTLAHVPLRSDTVLAVGEITRCLFYETTSRDRFTAHTNELGFRNNYVIRVRLVIFYAGIYAYIENSRVIEGSFAQAIP